MPTPKTPANTVANGLRRHQVRVFRVAEDLNGKAQQRIVGVRAELVRLVAQGDPTEPSRLGDRINRVDAVTAEARKVVGSEYRKIGASTASDLADLADHDQSVMAGLITSSTGETGIVTLAGKTLDLIVDRALVDGAPSADWWRGQAADVVKRFHDQVNQGMRAGESVSAIIQRVRGTAAKDYTDGILRVPLRNAESLVRSSVMSVLHDTRVEEYRQNSDVVHGWAILTTFDSRTCERCMALSGASFDLDGNPLPGSPFPHRLPSDGLPIHIGCRCIATPILIGEEPPQDLDFESWLQDQPVAEQKDILGPQWWAAWKSGELHSLRDRIDQRGRPLTLKQIRGEQRKAA